MEKPKIDPVTGCAHIKNYPSWRGCSVCGAGVPECVSQRQYIEEEVVEYCWACGATFDHTDDDPKEE